MSEITEREKALRKMYKPASEESYAKAKKIINILVKNKVIHQCGSEDSYINIWNAALEIVKS